MGFIHHSSNDAVVSEEADETQSRPSKGKGDAVALDEKIKMLEVQGASLREKLEKEGNEKEGFSREIARLSQALSLEQERVSGLNRELQQQRAIQEEATLELAALKERNKSQEEKIQILLQEIGAASQISVEEKPQVKTLDAELGLLNRSCPVVDVDLAKQEIMSGDDDPLPTRVNADPKSTFHCSVEGIWRISQQIINASSQKTGCISDLMQQIEQLKRKTSQAEEEKSQLTLKLSETISQRDAFVQEKTSLLNQLRDLEQRNAFYAEKYKEEENRAVERIKTNEDLLEECRAKDARIVSLEKTLKDKDLAILAMKQSVRDVEEKLGISEAKIGRLVDQESQLKVEVLDLKRLNEVEREKSEELKQPCLPAPQRIHFVEGLHTEDLQESPFLFQTLDVRCKEKIIDDMRLTLEEQERTQSEQDQILQATLAENERCTAASRNATQAGNSPKEHTRTSGSHIQQNPRDRTDPGEYQNLTEVFSKTECNILSATPRLINEVLHEHFYMGVLVYLSDIFIYMETMADHISLVQQVLEKPLADNLYIKLSKCEFHHVQLDYLAYHVSNEGIEMDPAKVQAVLGW
ncbi:PREDICTED: kinesin-like protein KIF20B [Thamnophis sirtalis]|uniref:Kinesin-like protein KIF20B n=1 Tax=Thamnophis sirtalis TaxID=35019 RepID=A0A6I9YIT4_9SAUR|nr:PREDICTED: kinesin-like protein KIF20B [Thamnophis sirtalis]